MVEELLVEFLDAANYDLSYSTYDDSEYESSYISCPFCGAAYRSMGNIATHKRDCLFVRAYAALHPEFDLAEAFAIEQQRCAEEQAHLKAFQDNADRMRYEELRKKYGED